MPECLRFPAVSQPMENRAVRGFCSGSDNCCGRLFCMTQPSHGLREQTKLSHMTFGAIVAGFGFDRMFLAVEHIAV